MEKSQDLEFKKLQKEQALERMKLLKIHKNPINEFKNENKINYSEQGALYWVENELKEYIENWEKETNSLVYHVIKDYTTFGTLYSLLYVSNNVEEWEDDIQNIKNGCCIAYVYNSTNDYCSEFGYIGIEPSIGGVIRTYTKYIF